MIQVTKLEKDKLLENGCKFLKNDSGNTPLRSNFFELLLTRSSCSSRTF